MTKYNVEIESRLFVTIDADSFEDAKQKVMEDTECGEKLLSNAEVIDVEEETKSNDLL